MNPCIERLTRFDDIRIMKLTEIIYYTLISLLLTIFTANLLESDSLYFIFKKYDYEKEDTYLLIKDIIIDVSILTIYIYYLKKILSCVPFVLNPLVPKYKSGMKNEIATGIILGSGIILYTSLTTIKEKLKVLNIRVKKYID